MTITRRPTRPLRRRWMAAFAGFTLGVCALFGLFAMAFVYTVEDGFINRWLANEAERQRVHHAAQGRWAPPADPAITLHLDATTLPADVATVLATEPARREIAGEQGRHYHLLPLSGRAGAPWLVAEVSAQLIVRPMREWLLRWLVLWGLALATLALAVAAWLARRTSAPLERLANQVASASPQALPARLAQGLPDDEVGALARAFDTLHARTAQFIAREQAFTRDASHELRTPLAVLQIVLERLLGETPAGDARRRSLITLQAAALAMQQTVETLLTLAREAPPPLTPATPVALLPLVEDWVLRHAEWLDQQGCSLQIRLGASDVLPIAEPALRLVITNLLGNAVVHGDASAPISVAMHEGALVVSNANRAPDAPHSEGEGHGLGIVQRLLARHGGHLQWQQEGGRTWAAVRVCGSAEPAPVGSAIIGALTPEAHR